MQFGRNDKGTISCFSRLVGRMGDTHDDFFHHIEEALHLASTAVAQDSSGNYSAAYDYYDLVILSLNEALEKSPPGSAQESKIISLRAMYDDRLTLLSDCSKFDIGGMISSGNISSNGSGAGAIGGKRTPHQEEEPASSSSSSSSPKRTSAGKDIRKYRRASQVPFSYDLGQSPQTNCIDGELACGWVELEKPPTSLISQPYWLLRAVGKSIRDGGFITPSIHVPKDVWQLPGSKLGGLPSKTSALVHIRTAIDQFIAPLPMKPDVSDLERALVAMNSTVQELAIMQNTLHKSFPFIAEAPLEAAIPAEPTTGAASSIFGRLGSLGKYVRKTAEVGLSRLSAMQTRISLDDLHSYSTLVLIVCDKAQIFESWQMFVTGQRDELLKEGPQMTVTSALQKKIVLLEDLLMALVAVATFMREVVCELLLRDLEALVTRHLEKMRKSMVRMAYEEEENDEDG